LTAAFPDADVGLVEASGGLFEVSMDGKLIYSKRAKGRHAEPGEVLRLVRQAME
jgi:selenoprotein W-related protein